MVGGLVPFTRESLFRDQWNETLAEYTSVWGLEKGNAEALQRKWSDGYAALEAEKDKPLLEIWAYSAHWKVNEAITSDLALPSEFLSDTSHHIIFSPYVIEGTNKLNINYIINSFSLRLGYQDFSEYPDNPGAKFDY
jgi:hypothetical protein